MNLIFASFLTAALARGGHAAQPRFRTTPKINKGAAAARDGGHAVQVQPRVGMPKSKKGTKGSDRTTASDLNKCSVGESASKSQGGSAIYTMTNQPNNQVLVYSRDVSDGTLTYAGAVATGGDGGQGGAGTITEPNNSASFLTNDPTTTQNIMVVTGNCLLGANAASNEVSSFVINPASGWIELAGTYPTGGFFPGSITVQEDIVYVLNMDGNGSLKGFRLDESSCELEDIEDGFVELSLQGGGPFSDEVAPQMPIALFSGIPQVSFAPNGDLVLLIRCNGGGQNLSPTEACTHSIVTFAVDRETGAISYPLLEEVLDGENLLLFGFDFDSNDRILASFLDFPIGGMDGGDGGVVAFEKDDEGSYKVVDTYRNERAFTCWDVYNPQNSCLYTSNTGGSVSAVSDTGNGLELINQVDGLVGALDITLSQGGEYIYTVSNIDVTGAGQPYIAVLKTDCGCGLEEVQRVTDGLPTEAERIARDTFFNGLVGIAAYPSN